MYDYRYYVASMTAAPTTMISFRVDPRVERALEELLRDGITRTEAIKTAILLAADLHRRDRLRAEAAQLAADPDDLAEIRAVREDLDAARAW